MQKIKKCIKNTDLKLKILNFLKWKCIDIFRFFKYGKVFSEFGLTLFCGKQGGGKTVAMVDYLERMRKKYPKVKIYTNFGYKNEDGAFIHWKQLLKIRNGLDGVIFAVDEIQNEWNSNDWKDFPESILSQITQQRKQRIKIVGTSQVFTRVVKQLREQTYEVVECRTLAGRWTFTRCFDAEDYTQSVIDNPELKKHVKRKWRYSFVQTDSLRELFDSYSVVENMAKKDYIPRDKRVY
jgi:hypothetical protein